MDLGAHYEEYCLDNGSDVCPSIFHNFTDVTINNAPPFIHKIEFSDPSLTEDNLVPALLSLTTFIVSLPLPFPEREFLLPYVHTLSISNCPLSNTTMESLTTLLQLLSERGGLSVFSFTNSFLSSSHLPTLLSSLATCKLSSLTLQSVGFTSSSFSLLTKYLPGFSFLRELDCSNLTLPKQKTNHLDSIQQRSAYSILRKGFAVSNVTTSLFKLLEEGVIDHPNSMVSSVLLALIETVFGMQNLKVLNLGNLAINTESAIKLVLKLGNSKNNLYFISFTPPMPFCDQLVYELKKVFKIKKENQTEVFSIDLGICKLTNEKGKSPEVIRPLPKNEPKLSPFPKISFSAGAGLLGKDLLKPRLNKKRSPKNSPKKPDSSHQLTSEQQGQLALLETKIVNIEEEIMLLKGKEDSLVNLANRLTDLSKSLTTQESKDKLDIQSKKIESALDDVMAQKRDLFELLSRTRLDLSLLEQSLCICPLNTPNSEVLSRPFEDCISEVSREEREEKGTVSSLGSIRVPSVSIDSSEDGDIEGLSGGDLSDNQSDLIVFDEEHSGLFVENQLRLVHLENRSESQADEERETVSQSFNQSQADDERETVSQSFNQSQADDERETVSQSFNQSQADDERETVSQSFNQSQADDERETVSQSFNQSQADDERETVSQSDDERETVSQSFNQSQADDERETVSQSFNQSQADDERETVSQSFNQSQADDERETVSQSFNQSQADDERETVSQSFNQSQPETQTINLNLPSTPIPSTSSSVSSIRINLAEKLENRRKQLEELRRKRIALENSR
ncbi:hypothetical protein P9112_011167 [Eukaryota sp. TZLM1-RC]